VELRDHAKDLLHAIAADMHLQQTPEEQHGPSDWPRQATDSSMRRFRIRIPQTP
jgi:hypothetical protein